MSKNLEQIMKDKFQHFEAEVSSDLFDKIIEKRTKKGAFWISWAKWSAAALLLIIASWVGYNYFSENAQQHSELTSGQNEEVQSNNQNVVQTPSEQDNSTENSGEQGQLANENVEPRSGEGTSEGGPNDHIDIAPSEVERVLIPQDNEQIEVSDPAPQPALAHEEDEVIEIANDISDAATNNVVIVESEELPVLPEFAENDQKRELTNDQSLPELPSLYSLDVLMGTGMSIYSGIPEEGAGVYIKGNESQALSSMFEVAVSRKFNDQWSLRMGLRYSNVARSFKAELNNEWYDTMISQRNITIYHPVNPPQVITVSDTNITFNSVNTPITANNRFVSVSIPIEIERQFYFGNRWMLMGKIGTVVNLYSKQSGMMQLSKDQFVKIEDGYENNFGILSATAGLGVGYKMTDKVSLLMYPQYTLYRSGQADSRAFDTQVMMGNIGLRIDL